MLAVDLTLFPNHLIECRTTISIDLNLEHKPPNQDSPE